MQVLTITGSVADPGQQSLTCTAAVDGNIGLRFLWQHDYGADTTAALREKSGPDVSRGLQRDEGISILPP